jgi:hypothetical protein
MFESIRINRDGGLTRIHRDGLALPLAVHNAVTSSS